MLDLHDSAAVEVLGIAIACEPGWIPETHWRLHTWHRASSPACSRKFVLYHADKIYTADTPPNTHMAYCTSGSCFVMSSSTTSAISQIAFKLKHPRKKDTKTKNKNDTLRTNLGAPWNPGPDHQLPQTPQALNPKRTTAKPARYGRV